MSPNSLHVYMCILCIYTYLTLNNSIRVIPSMSADHYNLAMEDKRYIHGASNAATKLCYTQQTAYSAIYTLSASFWLLHTRMYNVLGEFIAKRQLLGLRTSTNQDGR